MFWCASCLPASARPQRLQASPASTQRRRGPVWHFFILLFSSIGSRRRRNYTQNTRFQNFLSLRTDVSTRSRSKGIPKNTSRARSGIDPQIDESMQRNEMNSTCEDQTNICLVFGKFLIVSSSARTCDLSSMRSRLRMYSLSTAWLRIGTQPKCLRLVCLGS